MKIDISLKEAVDMLDLSSRERRCGATALAIVLLDRIWHAESNDDYDNLLRYYDRLESEFYLFGIYEGEDNLYVISQASSMLYHAYCLKLYRRYGINKHLKEIELATSKGGGNSPIVKKTITDVDI
jgi:hypothetical protein